MSSPDSLGPLPWVKMSIHHPEHPKAQQAGPLAAYLDFCGICWCRRHMTDGFIPEAVARRLVDWSGIYTDLFPTDMAYQPTPKGTLAGTLDTPCCIDLAERLVFVGRWVKVEGGYRIHDYLDWQEPESTRLTRHQTLSAAGKRGAKAKAKGYPQARVESREGRVESSSASATPQRVFLEAWNKEASESGLPRAKVGASSRDRRIHGLWRVCGSEEVFRAAVRAFHLWPFAREKRLRPDNMLTAKNDARNAEWGHELLAGENPHANGQTTRLSEIVANLPDGPDD